MILSSDAHYESHVSTCEACLNKLVGIVCFKSNLLDYILVL